MIDRQKVITGLELCTNISPDGCLMLCPYKDEKDETYSGFCEQVLKQDALDLLKEQETANIYKCQNCGTWVSAENVVRCKECRFLIDHYGFMDDGYCRNMRNEHNIKFKPDKDWFCADGKRKEGR